jgi:hypothetical protein
MGSKESILRSMCASSKLKFTYGYADSLIAAAVVISIPIDIDIPIHIDSDSGSDIITIFNITSFVIFIHIED